MVLEPGRLQTPTGVAELSIKACSGPVMATPEASGCFVRGSSLNVSGNHETLLIRTQGPSESEPHIQGLVVIQYPAGSEWVLVESLLTPC